MKSYPTIIARLFYEPISITAAKHSAICGVLESHLSGGRTPKAGMFDDEDGNEEPDDYGYVKTGSTAIIPVRGIIGKHLDSLEMMSGGCDLDKVSAMIDMAFNDDDVETMIFNFNSPGGSVTGVPEIARKIAGIVSKNTVAYTDSECCSAAVWMATQCQQFYCSESSQVGSIGVWCAYMDASRALANEGVNIQSVSAGKYKLMGAYWKALTDEEKNILQARVDKLHAQFKGAVTLHRELDPKYMEGQIFDGEEALSIGLVDGLLDDISDLIDES